MSFDTGVKEKIKKKKKKTKEEEEEGGEDKKWAKKKSTKYNVLHLEEMVDNLSIQNATLVGLLFNIIFQALFLVIIYFSFSEQVKKYKKKNADLTDENKGLTTKLGGFYLSSFKMFFKTSTNMGSFPFFFSPMYFFCFIYKKMFLL